MKTPPRPEPSTAKKEIAINYSKAEDKRFRIVGGYDLIITDCEGRTGDVVGLPMRGERDAGGVMSYPEIMKLVTYLMDKLRRVNL